MMLMASEHTKKRNRKRDIIIKKEKVTYEVKISYLTFKNKFPKAVFPIIIKTKEYITLQFDLPDDAAVIDAAYIVDNLKSLRLFLYLYEKNDIKRILTKYNLKFEKKEVIIEHMPIKNVKDIFNKLLDQKELPQINTKNMEIYICRLCKKSEKNNNITHLEYNLMNIIGSYADVCFHKCLWCGIVTTTFRLLKIQKCLDKNIICLLHTHKLYIKEMYDKLVEFLRNNNPLISAEFIPADLRYSLIYIINK